MSDPIQVQLVGVWWEQIIPIAALLISLFSVVLTLAFRYGDRLRLKVDTSWSTMLDQGMEIVEGHDFVTVEVINHSRTTTTEITQLTLQMPDKQTFAYTEPGEGDDQLPATIGPGQRVSISYRAQGLGISLNGQASTASWVRAMAVSGHRRVYGSRDRGLAKTLRNYAIEHPYRGRGRP